MDLVSRRRRRGLRAAVDRLDPHLLHPHLLHPHLLHPHLLHPHLLHQRRNTPPPHRLLPSAGLQHPVAGKGVIQRQRVDPAHEREVGLRGRARQIGDAPSAEAGQLLLTADAQSVVALDHSFARADRPALPSAADKNPSLTSARQSSHEGFSHTPPAPLRLGGVAEHTGSAIQQLPAPLLGGLWVIWLGCTSNCRAHSASVLSPWMAAKATFALNAGLWFRRGRLAMLSPRSRLSGRSHAKTPLDSPVQFSRPTSH